MKRISAAFAAAFLLCVASSASAAPALIITPDACSMADGDGNFFNTEDVRIVYSNNVNEGNFTLKCQAWDVANSTGGPVKYDYDSTGGALCSWGPLSLSTTEWFENVSTTGNATLTCKFHWQDL